jgi:hypothetical protein
MTPDHLDHHRREAMKTNHGGGRGWDFRRIDEPPMAVRVAAEVLRPRSIVILAVMVGVMSLFWIS